VIGYNNRGIAYRNKGLYDQAIADYSRAIDLMPKFVIAYIDRGNAYYDKGLYALAETDFAKAIELDPKYEYPYLRLLNAAWMRKGNVTEASNRLSKYVASNDFDGHRLSIANYYLGAGGRSEQFILADIGKTKDGKRREEMLCEAYFFLGVKRLADGNRPGAADYFTRSIETNAADCDEYYGSKTMLSRMNEEYY
jgi:lipoprotein NlpI